MRIFVVEDDPDLLWFIVRLLLTDGREVVAFCNGREAVEALAGKPPEVLLCDIELPGLDGEDVARAAARLPRRPRIVLMSGELERLERARPLADRLLQKPFGVPQLLEALGPLS